MEMNIINTESRKELAVTVRNACKRFNAATVVLNRLNMTVPQGTIYGLLGPSGCGKTTLLNCILGRCQLDSGEIKVKVRKKANVGYMPQDISLFDEFSVIETMTYYGRIFEMSDSKILIETEELLEFLQLPDKSRIVGGMSGGQQRRVSFAVALLHNPQLIILDEPTVGVDPVLSASIWEKLLEMVSIENKTVIITTHYIEEARQAQTIGLFRNGRLLAEEPPDQLLIRYNCSNLEDVFLELSKKQFTGTASHGYENYRNDVYPTPVKKPELPLQHVDVSFSLRRISAQLMKNYYQLKKNKGNMGFFLLLPVVHYFLNSECIGRDPKDLKIAIVNEEVEHGISSCNWLSTDGCNFSIPLSCRLIEELQQKPYELVEYDDVNSAQNAIKKGKAWSLIYFSSNYTAALTKRILLKGEIDEITFDLSEINVWQDMSNQYISNQVRRDILRTLFEFLEKLYEDCGWHPRAAISLPFKWEKGIYGEIINPSFSHFMAPALIILFEFFLPMVYTVGAFMMEKTNGSLERSLISGVSLLEIVISHMIVQFVVFSIQTALTMVIMFIVYDNPLIGSLPLALLLLFFNGACGACYGLMLSMIFNKDIETSFLSSGSLFPLAIIGGMVWPIQGMPSALRTVVWLFPVALPTEALRAISAKGKNITDTTVYQGFLVSFLWTSFFLLVSTMIIKKKKGFGKK